MIRMALVVLFLTASPVWGSKPRGEILKGPALGRSVHLGGLFNARKDVFIPGNVWLIGHFY